MNLLNLFRRNNTQVLKPKKLSFKQRMALNTLNKSYVVKVAITFDDKPIRQFDTIVTAHSKNNAKARITKGLNLQILEVNRKK